MTKLLKAIIVDDQLKAIKTLRQDLLFLFPNSVQVIGESTTIEEAVILFKEFKPDLIFLDIDLKIGTGFDFLKQISAFDYANYDIIFTTAFNQFAIKAIKYSAFDYLLKPVDRDELENSINRLISCRTTKQTKSKIELILETEAIATNSKEKRIALTTAEEIHFVKIKDILRCEASHNYTTFYLVNSQKILVAKTIKEYEGILKYHSFVRTHQSHLVNLNYVSSFIKEDGGVLLMNNKVRVPVSRRKKEEVILALKQL